MKVLVIDDDKFTRNLFISELMQENMSVETATDGETGVAKIKEWNPDLVILDLILPRKDGFEVLAEIKKLPAELRAHLVIYVFSSLGGDHDRDEALALGAHMYFSKDHATVGKLIDTIRTQFSGASS